MVPKKLSKGFIIRKKELFFNCVGGMSSGPGSLAMRAQLFSTAALLTRSRSADGTKPVNQDTVYSVGASSRRSMLTLAVSNSICLNTVCSSFSRTYLRATRETSCLLISASWSCVSVRNSSVSDREFSPTSKGVLPGISIPSETTHTTVFSLPVII
jgi:hypothetical protein